MNSTTSNQATRLAALRRTSGLSLHQVAEKLAKAMGEEGRSHTSVQRWEKNEGIRIARPVLAALAKIYRTTPEYIEHGEVVASEENRGTTDSHIMGIIGRLHQMDYVDLPFVEPSTYSAFAANCKAPSVKDFTAFYILKLPGVDYHDAIVVEMKGNSMAPRYPERSRHVMRPVSDGNWQYAQGVHAIVLKSEMLVIKRITNNQDGVLTLSSDTGGSTMAVLLDDISCLWKVGETVFMPAED